MVQWVSFADSDIVPPASTWVFPTLGIMHHNKQVSCGTCLLVGEDGIWLVKKHRQGVAECVGLAVMCLQWGTCRGAEGGVQVESSAVRRLDQREWHVYTRDP